MIIHVILLDKAKLENLISSILEIAAEMHYVTEQYDRKFIPMI